MSSARSQIFHNIRHGLNRGALQGDALKAVENRLKKPAPNLIPARGQLPETPRRALFIEMAREAAAEVHDLSDLSALPRIATEVLKDAGVTQLVVGNNPTLQDLDWSESGLNIETRIARDGDLASLSTAFAGIAETGTLMLLSGPENPTTLNFLPDIHLVLLRAADIVGPYESAWQRLREERDTLPRAVNMITGPSRSADIEQRLQMGAHGPKRLIVFVLND